MPLLKISVNDAPELKAAIGLLKTFDRDQQREVTKSAKGWIQPEWQKAVAEHSTTYQEGRVLVSTARAAVSTQNVILSSATVGKQLSGGALPSEIARAVEFGANRFLVKQTARGKRHTQAQFRRENPKGYVVYPAAADIIPHIASLYVQTVVRTIYDAFGGE